MSVQSEFFEALLAELKARGLSDEVAEENVSKFKSQLSERAENDEYIDAALSKIPPASIAENICNMLRAETDEDAGAKSEVMVIDTDSDTVETTIKEGKDAMSPLSDGQPESADEACEEATAEPVEEAADAVEEAPEETTADDAAVEEEIIDVEFSDSSDDAANDEEAPSASDEEAATANDDFVYSDDIDDFTSFSDSAQSDTSADATADDAANNEGNAAEEDENDFSVYSPTSNRRINDSKKHTSPESHGEKKPVRLSNEAVDLFYDEDESKNSWLFIVMAVFLIPFFCVLGAISFAIVLGLWVGLAVVIAVLLLALAAIVVAGTAYAVLGLIFGIIEAFSGNPAAALFEVGLALCVGGIVMFVGIWVYNFAIRFIPFIIKKLGVLLILIFKLFKNALIKLKALCRKI